MSHQEDSFRNESPQHAAGPQGALRAPAHSMFPLSLSDFEWYMMADDRPGYPMVFLIAADVSGCPHETAFRSSLSQLVQLHPLLTCRVSGTGRSLFWQEPTYETVPCQWVQQSDEQIAGCRPDIRPLNPRCEPGIRVTVHAGAQSARIFMELHHACCDGIGAVQLMGELLARYGQITAKGDRRPVCDPPEVAQLRLREHLDAPALPTGKPGRRSVFRILGKLRRLLFRRPVRIAESTETGPRRFDTAAMQNPAQRRSVQPGSVYTAFLDADCHRLLRAVASRSGASINDLLIREMLMHVRDWNRARGTARPADWIRIAMPLSMRTALHQNIPACNLVSYALVTRRMSECDDPMALLASIHEHTESVLVNREGMIALKLFRVLRKIPGGMSLFAGLKSCLSTLVLANVGDIRRRFSGRFPLQNGKWIAGDVLVERIYGVAPVRPNTRASVSIGDYAGELAVSLRTDAAVITNEDSEKFLSRYIERLSHLASDSRGTHPLQASGTQPSHATDSSSGDARNSA